MNDIQKIKEFFSKSMEEAMDYNDPVLMKARAAAFQRSQPKPEPSKAFKNADKIKTLERERVQLMRDMEQEAEPEGGPIADRYGALLNKIDKAIAKLKGQPMMEEAMTTAYEGKDSSIEGIKVGDVLNLKDGETWKVIKLTSNGGVLAAPFGKTKDSYISIAIEFPAHILKNEVVSLNETKEKNKQYYKNVALLDKKGLAKKQFSDEDIQMAKKMLSQGQFKLNEAKSEDPVDTITMDIPLFLRMLEYSREDASQDMDLHDVTEKANKLGKEKGILSMEDYEEIVGAAEEIKEGMTAPEWNSMSKEDRIEILQKNFPKLSLKFADWKWEDLTPMIKNKLTGKVVKEDELDEASDYFKRRKAMDDYAVSKQDKPKKPYNPTPSGKTDYMKRREAEKGLEEKINEALNKINEELCPAGKAYIKKRKAAGEKSSAYLSGRAVKVCKGQMSGKSKKTNESIINEGQKINQNLDNLLNKIKKDFNIE